MNREEYALRSIKAVVDAIDQGNITITHEPDCFDFSRHIYSISVIHGVVRNHVYSGLGLNIPTPNRSK